MKKFGLHASKLMTQCLPDTEKRQYVLDQMTKDLTSKQGPCTIKEGIAHEYCMHLTRYILPCIIILLFNLVVRILLNLKCDSRL